MDRMLQYTLYFFCGAAVVALQFDPRNEVRIASSLNNKKLVAVRDFAPGDVILSLPVELCLLTRRDGCVKGLKGQTDMIWELAGDLRDPITAEDEIDGRTWDVNLALAVLDVTAGTGNAEVANFWDDYYSYLLPAAESLTLPFCSSEEFIDRYIQVPIVAKAAKLQKLRLRSLFPDLVQDHKAHRLSQFSLQNLDTEKSAVPYPLEWAFAVVRSRCFSVAPDWFAMLPMIDMCNHAHEPNAELDAKPKATKTFDLVAKSSIPRECEITISYSEWHANQRLYSQYGFVQENNVNDLISLAPVIIDSNIAEDLRGKMATESCLQSAIKVLTISFIEISSQIPRDGLRTEQRVEAALRSVVRRLDELIEYLLDGLPDASDIDSSNSRNPSADSPAGTDPVNDGEDEIARHLISGLRNAIVADVLGTRASYPTSLSQDNDLLVELRQSQDPFYLDPVHQTRVNRAQLEACVAFRAEHKRVLECMCDIVDALR